MTTTIDQSQIDAEHEDIARARADLIRRAEEQGVQPFNSFEDFAGDSEATEDFDVDEFLRQVREDRDRPSIRSVE